MSHSAQDQGINLLARCPSCEVEYRKDDARIVSQEGSSTILHLFCSYCSHALLLAVKYRRGGLSCTGVVTDWAYEDALRFWGAEKISVDDVIQTHAALKLDKFQKKS